MPAVEYEKHPVVDGAWDADEAVSSLRKWASSDGSGDKDKMEWSKYRKGFALVDGPEDDFTSYKYPHHKVVDGKLVTVKSGVSAAIAAAHGARSGTEAPSGVTSHLERHRAEWSEEKEMSDKVVFGDVLTLGEIVSHSDSGVIAKKWNHIAVSGKFLGHGQGPFEMNEGTFKEIIQNFRNDPKGMIRTDFDHASETLEGNVPQKGAPSPAWITDLKIENGKLFGLFEWIDPETVKLVRSGQFRWVSPAINFNAIDGITGQRIGAKLTSVAITNGPFLSTLQPLMASEKMGYKMEIADQEPRKQTDMAVHSSKIMSEMRRYMDDAEATEDKAVEWLRKAMDELKLAKQQEQESRMRSAEQAVKMRQDSGVIPAGTGAAKAAIGLYLSQRETFDLLYPEVQPKKIHATFRSKDGYGTLMGNHILSPEVVSESSLDESDDHSEKADELAQKLMSQNKSLTYDKAVVTASAMIKRDQINAVITRMSR